PAHPEAAGRGGDPRLGAEDQPGGGGRGRLELLRGGRADRRHHPGEGLRRSRRSGGGGDRPRREPQLRRGAGEGHRGVGGTDRRRGEEGHVAGRGELTMATEVQLPALSPTMTEGKIVKWLKKEGDSISSGEAIAEVETDKSNLEVEAFDDGVLLKILVAEGETGKVGAPIAVIGAKGEKVEASAAAPAPKAPAPSAPAPVPPKAAAKPSPA